MVKQSSLPLDRQGLRAVWASWKAVRRPSRCNCSHARPRKDWFERLAQGETIRY